MGDGKITLRFIPVDRISLKIKQHTSTGIRQRSLSPKLNRSALRHVKHDRFPLLAQPSVQCPNPPSKSQKEDSRGTNEWNLKQPKQQNTLIILMNLDPNHKIPN